MSAGALLLAAACALLCAMAARRDLTWAPAPTLLGIALILTASWFALATLGVFAALLVLTCALIVEIDRRHQLIPDLLVVSLALLSFAPPFWHGLQAQLIGAGLLSAVFLATRDVGRRLRGVEVLGLGDVKLAAAMGAMLGASLGFLAVAVAGAGTLIVLSLSRRRSEAAGAPFGIGLAAATAAIALSNAIPHAL